MFTGGTYYIKSLKADSKSKSHFAGETTLIIKHSFETGSKSYLGPSDESGIDASDILVYVEGDEDYGKKKKKNDDDEDNRGGSINSPKIAKVGSEATLRANLYAPSGTICISSKAGVGGSFIARDVSVGSQAHVSLMSGWDIPGVLYDPESAGPAAKLVVIDDIPEVEELTETSLNPN